MPDLPSPRDASVAPAPRPLNTHQDRASLSPLQFALARALPPLWRKASDRNMTPREQHKKMLELVVWVAEKQGCTAKQRNPVQYWQDHVKRDGTVDLMLFDRRNTAVLAVELDWARNEASIRKLQAASLQKIPVLSISGVHFDDKAQAKALRRFANTIIGKPTGWWLPIFHLTHGWL